MPAILKKRKRAAPKEDPDTKDTADGLDAMEIFRRHFESQFAPLPEVKGSKKPKKAVKGSKPGKRAKTEIVQEDEGEDDSGSEWEGLSEEEGDQKPAAPAPEVIHFTCGDPLLKTAKLPKSILKPFISTKPPPLRTPDAPTAPAKRPSSDPDSEEDTTAEAHLLQNDLALQRLLRESHLLDENLEATGKNRLKAIEARVQALGGKDLTKHKMPMADRVWMEKSRKAKEEKRRREAREAGVVLEREVRVKKEVKRRERGFGPSVGKFRNGTLVLSRRDVMDIEGRSGGEGRGGKGKKRR
ncbi:uncharacterized protein H6S33_002303 [Morchella sextelata]|uniref:uncharacterized protein n=1 Tax=Morchella sextelata TaxID=1174677 RepID=UPI001D04B56A|nr:uncharacterized protein H6S33_002303 [Morchella sextelata]KAH0608251.1 hypothetical protein H6S33_002303 [Morchella sextelata]